MTKIENIAWCLPRPRKCKYQGGFPLHAELKLIRECGIDPKEILWPSSILHPFGGKAEFGIRIDLNGEVKPDIFADAHNLPIKSGIFDVVFLDPPYNDEYSKTLYKTGKLSFKKYTQEAVRVLKENGYLIMYHFIATPQIPGTVMVKRVFIETRPWHRPRVVHIHKKSRREWEIKHQEIKQVRERRAN